jgi:hypothetical protein
MRYVIVIVAFTAFLIWDGLKNDAHYIEQGVRALTHLFHMIGV